MKAVKNAVFQDENVLGKMWYYKKRKKFKAFPNVFQQAPRTVVDFYKILN